MGTAIEELLNKFANQLNVLTKLYTTEAAKVSFVIVHEIAKNSSVIKLFPGVEFMKDCLVDLALPAHHIKSGTFTKTVAEVFKIGAFSYAKDGNFIPAGLMQDAFSPLRTSRTSKLPYSLFRFSLSVPYNCLNMHLKPHTVTVVIQSLKIFIISCDNEVNIL